MDRSYDNVAIWCFVLFCILCCIATNGGTDSDANVNTNKESYSESMYDQERYEYEMEHRTEGWEVMGQ